MRSFLGVLVASSGFASAVATSHPLEMPKIPFPPTFTPPVVAPAAVITATKETPSASTNAHVTTNASLPASYAPADSTALLPAPGFENSVALAAKNFDTRGAKKSSAAIAHPPPADTKHHQSGLEKLEAKVGWLEKKDSGFLYSEEKLQEVEESDVPVNISQSITSAFRHPRLTLGLSMMFVLMVGGLGSYWLYRLLKLQPDVIENNPLHPPGVDDIENGRTPEYLEVPMQSQIQQLEATRQHLDASWMRVEALWQRSPNCLSFLRALTHGQSSARESLIQSAHGDIEMQEALAAQEPQEQAQPKQAPQEQGQPKQVPQSKSTVKKGEDATDEYQQLLTPREAAGTSA